MKRSLGENISNAAIFVFFSFLTQSEFLFGKATEEKVEEGVMVSHLDLDLLKHGSHDDEEGRLC